jgi:chromosome segregation ATPase
LIKEQKKRLLKDSDKGAQEIAEELESL